MSGEFTLSEAPKERQKMGRGEAVGIRTPKMVSPERATRFSRPNPAPAPPLRGWMGIWYLFPKTLPWAGLSRPNGDLNHGNFAHLRCLLPA